MLSLINLFSIITMALHSQSYKETLPVMLFGMIAIFIVIGVIIIATYLLNKAFSRKKKDDTDNQ